MVQSMLVSANLTGGETREVKLYPTKVVLEFKTVNDAEKALEVAYLEQFGKPIAKTPYGTGFRWVINGNGNYGGWLGEIFNASTPRFPHVLDSFDGNLRFIELKNSIYAELKMDSVVLAMVKWILTNGNKCGLLGADIISSEETILK